jgi:Zn-dependent protease with chaperone function
MLPIQFILLLIIVCLPRELAQANQAPPVSPLTLPSLFHLPAIPAYGLLCLLQAGLVAYVVMRTRRAIARLHEPTIASVGVTRTTDSLFARARWMTILLTVTCLFTTPLASAAIDWSRSAPAINYFLVIEIVLLLPAMLAWLAIWTAAYHVDAAVRERSLPFQLAQSLPVHEMPALGSYLAMQVRHNFFPIIFLVFQAAVLALADGISFFDRGTQGDTAQVLAAIICGIPLLLTLPFLLTRLWSTTPLLGTLRQTLDAVAARYGLRFRDIRLWHTHNMVLNAAIIGWLPQIRYFLMSDHLIENFSDRHLEAIFAHEVGHGIHRHLNWLLLTILSAVTLTMGITGLVEIFSQVNTSQTDYLSLILSAILLCLFGGGAIAFVSPRFEHQADWFACRHMALRLRENPALAGPWAQLPPEPAPAVDAALTPDPTPAESITLPQYIAGNYPHNPADSPAPSPAPARPLIAGLTPEVAGAEIFVSSLHTLVDAANRDRNRRGFFHPSINNRVALVRQLAADPTAEARFNRSMRRLRWLIVALAAAAATSFAAALILDKSQSHSTQNQEILVQHSFSHSR